MSRSATSIRPLLVLTALASGTLTSLAEPQEARAVAAPFSYIYLNADQFPSGGVITGTIGCSGYSCSAGGPSITDEMGNPVPGSFLIGGSLSGTFVFLPEPPLPPGNYQATASGTFGGTSAYFEIVEATDELPTVATKVNIARAAAGETVGCVETAVTNPLTFSSKTLASPALFVTISGTYSTQYRYALVHPGVTPTPGVFSSSALQYDTWDTEVCYELYGSTYTNDEMILIDSGCEDITALELGELDEPYGAIDSTLASCTVPPDGFEDRWCANFNAAITQQTCNGFMLESCYAARRACPGGDNPSFEEEDAAIAERDAEDGLNINDTSTTGDEPTSGGTTTTEDTGTSTGEEGDTSNGNTSTGSTSTGTGETDDSDETGTTSGPGQSNGTTSDRAGCSTAPSPSAPHHWSLLGLGWLLLLGNRLRRSGRTTLG